MKKTKFFLLSAALITLAACSASAATLPLGETGAQVTLPSDKYAMEEVTFESIAEFMQSLTGQPFGSLEAQALEEIGMEGHEFLVNKGEDGFVKISAFSMSDPESDLIEPFLMSFKTPEAVEAMIGDMYPDVEQQSISENDYGYTVHYANDYAVEIMGYYKVEDKHILCQINKSPGTQIIFTEVNKAFDICSTITKLEGATSETGEVAEEESEEAEE